MLTSQKLDVKRSELRSKALELAGLDKLDDDQRAELDALEKRSADLEAQYRAAVTAEAAAPAEASPTDPAGSEAGSEDVELRALRARVGIGGFLAAALAGREVRGAEAEYAEAVGCPPGANIPLDLFEPTVEQRSAAVEHRTATGAPSTVGVNLAPIFPAIFARAVLPRLGVAMPMVESGTAAVATISTDLTAAAVAAGAAQPATAAAFTAQTTTPHRVSAVLETRIEDIAAAGTASFESSLRQNLMLAMSAQLDQLGLNGDGTGNNPTGLLTRLTDPTDPTGVVDWAGFVAAVAAGIDGGPWAETMRDVKLLTNAETMRLAEQTFRQPGSVGTPADQYSDTPGELSAAAYLRRESGGFMASSRMPATSSTIAAAIRVSGATMGLDGVNAMELARCPVWGHVAVDDIYTMSTAGTRRFSMHALIGDVMVIQPGAYTRVDLKVS